MAHLLIAIDSNKPFGTAKDSRTLMRRIADYLSAGQFSGVTDAQLMTNDSTTFGSDKLAYASAAGTVASGSGTLTTTINGTAVAVTWATSDINSAGLMAAAINANASVNRLVEATNQTARINMGTPAVGNRVFVCGVEFVCVATPARINEFSTAANFITAVNAHPSLKHKLYAAGPTGSNSVSLCKRKNYSLKPNDTVTQIGAMAIVGPNFPASQTYGIGCLTPGLIGNCITVTTAGTGNVAEFVTGGKLTGGAGGFTSLVRAY